ncbi:unnamed protein product [Ectocarpus sp. 13 AM-2016]
MELQRKLVLLRDSVTALRHYRQIGYFVRPASTTERGKSEWEQRERRSGRSVSSSRLSSTPTYSRRSLYLRFGDGVQISAFSVSRQGLSPRDDRFSNAYPKGW